MKTLQFEGQISSISAKVDGSLGLRLNTPQLESEEKVEVMKLQNLNLNVTLNPSEEPGAQTIQVKNKVDGKTPSQRLRSVLYVLWSQTKKPGDQDFELFYTQKINSIVEKIKERLD